MSVTMQQGINSLTWSSTASVVGVVQRSAGQVDEFVIYSTGPFSPPFPGSGTGTEKITIALKGYDFFNQTGESPPDSLSDLNLAAYVAYNPTLVVSSVWRGIGESTVTDKWAINFRINTSTLSVSAGNGVSVAEPTTLLLLGIGLIGLAGLSRKKFFK